MNKGIRISENGRYLTTSEGRPFLWTGDTAWELIHRLTREDISFYLDNRLAKGFNVIQTVILGELDGIHEGNAYGHTPLIDDDPCRINECYFKHVDFVLDEAEKRELIVGLLPTWGDKISLLWGKGPLIFTPENAWTYGRILGERYRNRPNIVWILGGDRIPETDVQKKIFQRMALGIRETAPDHLMTYHPLNTNLASDHFDESWMDLDMYQSGHDCSEQEYRYLQHDQKKSRTRPIINGEARYENIGNVFWDKKDEHWLDDWDVRVSAWWSILAGAAGYTYGCNDVWQMYEPGREPIIQARTGWKEALDLPGAKQTGMMKAFLEKLPWQDLRQNQDLILNSNPEDDGYVVCASTDDCSLVLAYTPKGRTMEINLSTVEGPEADAWWYNPRSGATLFIGRFPTGQPGKFIPWATGRGSDFVLAVIGCAMHWTPFP